MFSYLSPLYIVNISPLLDVKFVKNLVLFYMLPLFPDDGVLQHAGGIELHVVSFNNFISRAYANGFLVRDFFFPVPASFSLFFIISSIRFRVSSFMLRYLIHLELSVVDDDKYVSICILLHVDFQFDQYYLF